MNVQGNVNVRSGREVVERWPRSGHADTTNKMMLAIAEAENAGETKIALHLRLEDLTPAEAIDVVKLLEEIG